MEISGAFSASANRRGVLQGAMPREAVGYLKGMLDDRTLALELCAGTGILTGALSRAGCRVIATESDRDRLAQLRRSLPGVPAVRSSDRELPIRSASVGAVVLNVLTYPKSAQDNRLLLLQLAEVERICRQTSLLIFVGPGPSDGGEAERDLLSASMRQMPQAQESKYFAGSDRYVSVQISAWRWS